jgi:hypothetical protein
MDVLNMNTHAVHPRLIGPDGKVDSVTVMPKRRVTIPDGFRVDPNWIGSVPKVSVFESKTSRIALSVGSSVGSVVAVVANAVKTQGSAQVSVPVAASNATDDAIAAAQRQAQLAAEGQLAALRDSASAQVAAPVEVAPEAPEVAEADDAEDAAN